MANAIICTNDLITASGVTFTHSTEVAGYEAEQVQIYQPGESFRTTVLDPGYIQANAINRSVDIIAALYTNATAHRNLMQQSNELDTTWTDTNCAVSQETSHSAAPGAAYSWQLTDDATSGQHSIVQSRSGSNLPGSYGSSGVFKSSVFTASAYVSPHSDPLDVRLRIESASNRYMECSFDLGAGTAGTPAEDGAGDWGNGSATITAVTPTQGTSDWYRITLTAEFIGSTASSLFLRIMLESGGNVSYSGSADHIHVQGVQLENGSAATAWTATTTDLAGFMRASDGSTAIEGWEPITTADATGEDFLHVVKYIADSSAVENPRMSIYDSGNADAYIEFGNFIVAASFQPDKNIGSDWHIGWGEDGGSSRSPGGQLYRPVNKRYRRGHMAHTWLTESEAWAEAYEIDRLAGRSEGVLISIDPTGTYSHKQTLWGLQEDISAVVHRTYSKDEGGTVYAKEWDFIEALP